MKIGILGGGAAGFFGAIHCAEMYPQHEVILLEKANKLLAKVLVSGGGRCNVTHDCPDNGLLVQFYPRGNKELRSAFEKFSVKDTITWYKKRGVILKTESDGRMFPITDNSETIANCLLDAARNAGVKIYSNQQQVRLYKNVNGFTVKVKDDREFHFDRILIATGGFPKPEGFNWLKNFGHNFVEPVPSLFTFNLKDHPLSSLPGISVEKTEVKVMGTKLIQEGPLLITHWGLSGPAILRLSAWGARDLQEKDYKFDIMVNWLPNYKEEALRVAIDNFKEQNIKKQIQGQSPFREISARLWKWFCDAVAIPDTLKWADISKKQMNVLVEKLLRSVFPVEGKSTFKDEFVTAGGVSLKDVDFKTMQSKKCPGMYFAGEVLNIDAITGGFNFQAAWTTGYIAGTSMGMEE